ncbi:MAG: MATE family efflux transporter [Bacteroidales bacterium]|nr:MATE family efflux transporter [Bacteroidales bacterium]
MAETSINRHILKLAVPSILANITVPLVGIADLAIAGHIGDASVMGGVAIGTMLFDMFYWTLGFLRAGTGGLTAQAYGRGDFTAAMKAFTQGFTTVIAATVLFFCLQWLFIDTAFRFIDCSAEVQAMARRYFFVRVWAIPASLSLFVFRGWFIGMQNTLLTMVVDVVVNVTNIAASLIFALPCKMGIAGIALGTVVAQWTGFTVSLVLMIVNYGKMFRLINVRESIRWSNYKKFFSLNVHLYFRSLLLLVVYTGFTSISARYGDVELAVSSAMMKLLLLYSYFTDGFAYAAEALTGRFIGAKDPARLKKTIHLVFIWCLAIGVVSTLVYGSSGKLMVQIFTNDPAVIAGCAPYLFWLVLMPIVSCIAFTWDGVYIGATASRSLVLSMLWSAVSFVAVYLILAPLMGLQALYAAYFSHLIVRSAYLTLVRRRDIPYLAEWKKS